MLRQHKLHCIAQLLELPAMASPPSHYYSITPPAYVNLGPGQLESPTDSLTEPTDEEFDRHASLQAHAQSSGDMSQDSVQASLAGAMATPEQCLSPMHGFSRFSRTTSQAEALASVLEQSPPAVKTTNRSMSVEEATEAIEMELTNALLQAVQENDSSGDSTPVEGLSRSHSVENLSHITAKRNSVSFSAPSTPRGERRSCPPIKLNEVDSLGRLNTQNSMSEPSIFLSGQWDSPPAQANKQVERKPKKTGSKKAAQRGKGRQRKR